MKNSIQNKQQGLIQMIVLVIIGIAVLSWFRIDIKDFFMSEQFQKNLGYVVNFLKDVWTDYLAGPADKLWGIWLEYFWTPFLQKIK